MALTDQENEQLNKLQAKAGAGLSDQELRNIEGRIRNLYNYDEAFKALMIWQSHADMLREVVRDNAVLVNEMRRLRKFEKAALDKEPPG